MSQIAESDRKQSRVTTAARELIAMSLNHEGGTFLGGEDDLIMKLGISRLTLRQAAKIAEHERMIEVKRGNRGGFYARRPSAVDAVQSLAGYLHLHGTTLAHVQRVLQLITDECAAIAALNPNSECREKLRKISIAARADDPRSNVIRRDVELTQTIAAMSGNPLIEVIVAIGNTFGLDDSTTIFVDPAQRTEMADRQIAVCEAILSGDPEISVIMMRRRAESLGRWIAAESKISK